jgi:predicted metal-dependent TIM-barrel fold hydrolase
LQKEEKLNAILDKIGRSGFESLTSAEKNFLEEQSKK